MREVVRWRPSGRHPVKPLLSGPLAAAFLACACTTDPLEAQTASRDLSLRGIVRDRAGAPASGVRVYAAAADLGQLDGWLDSLKTGADGTFEFRADSDGVYVIAAFRGEAEGGIASVSLPADSARVILLQLYTLPQVLRGVVRAPSRRVVPGIWVHFFRSQPWVELAQTEPIWKRTFWRDSVRTGPRGDFAFRLTVPGIYSIDASRHHERASIDRTLPAPPGAIITLNLEPFPDDVVMFKADYPGCYSLWTNGSGHGSPTPHFPDSISLSRQIVLESNPEQVAFRAVRVPPAFARRLGGRGIWYSFGAGIWIDWRSDTTTAWIKGVVRGDSLVGTLGDGWVNSRPVASWEVLAIRRACPDAGAPPN
jgi:hypothetical protein